jgi:hypothetical protein
MSETRFSRRYFFYGSLLAGAVPAGGFGSTPSLKAAGFKSVLDKLNVAGIGGRGGALFVGEKGYMATCDRGEGVWLLPGSRWADYKLPPQILPRSVSHQQDWVRACKGGEPGCSTKLMWDAKNMRFDNAEANKYLRPYVRKGWEMKL